MYFVQNRRQIFCSEQDFHVRLIGLITRLIKRQWAELHHHNALVISKSQTTKK